MRIRKRWLLYALPFFAMATGCSEYDHVQNIKFDDVNPEFVLPVVNDKITLEDMLERPNEETKILYEDDGMAYVVYNQRIQLSGEAVAPRRTWQGEKSGIPLSTSLKDRYVFVNVNPYGKLSQNVENPPVVTPALIQVTQATIAASSYTVGIKVTASAAGEDISGMTLTGNMGIYGKTMPFEVPTDQLTEFNMNNLLNSKTFVLNMDEGGKLLYSNSGKTYAEYETANHIPFSFAHSEIPIHFTDLQFKKDGAPADPKAYTLLVSFKATDVKPSSIKGKVSSLIPLDDLAFKMQEGVREIELFQNAYAAELSLPKSQVIAEIKKPKGVDVRLKVGSLNTIFTQDAQGQTGETEITNTADVDDNTLLIGKENMLAADIEEKTLVLNQQNSNVAIAFGQGANKLKVTDLELGVDFTTKDVVVDLPTSVPSMKMQVKLPFYGRAVSNTFSDDLPIPDGAFGSKKDVDQVLQYMAGDEKAKIGESTQASVDAVSLLFRFKNNMPLDMFASVVFLDESKNVVLKMRLNAKEGTQPAMLDNVPVLMVAGKVENGKVVAPVVTEAVAKLSKAEFKLLTEKAKYARTIYKMTSPEAGQGKDVALYRDNHLQMTMAVDLKSRLSFGK